LAQLTGPSGTVHSTKGNLTFDARGSSDPDDPHNAASQMSYLWSCQNAVDLSPCFGSQVDSVWSVDPSKVGHGALASQFGMFENVVVSYMLPRAAEQLLALAASGMSYLWSCQNAVDLSPCFGSQVDGVWSIDPSNAGALATWLGTL
jgi:hypothetical protein